MKTILTRMKTLVTDNMGSGQTLSYVQQVEIVHPEVDLLTINIQTLPKILIIPGRTNERWVASQQKEATHSVKAYLMILYNLREGSIMGDPSVGGASGVGIVDFVADFLTVFRGHRLASGGVNYLDKPLDISDAEYIMQQIAEDAHILVASITMQLSRLFLQTSLPTNV